MLQLDNFERCFHSFQRELLVFNSLRLAAVEVRTVKSGIEYAADSGKQFDVESREISRRG
jgi:hypothetical protein